MSLLDGSNDRVSLVMRDAMTEAIYPGDTPPAVAATNAVGTAYVYTFGLFVSASENLDRDAKLLMLMALREFANVEMTSEVAYAAFDRLIDEAL